MLSWSEHTHFTLFRVKVSNIIASWKKPRRKLNSKVLNIFHPFFVDTQCCWLPPLADNRSCSHSLVMKWLHVRAALLAMRGASTERDHLRAQGVRDPLAATGSDKSSGYFHQSDRNRVDQNKQKALFCLVCTLCTLPLGNLISLHASCFYL